MIIPIDRQKRITLLKWLKQGFIDGVELHSLQASHSLTREELEDELDRLTMAFGDDECQRLQRLGLCGKTSLPRRQIDRQKQKTRQDGL